MLSMFQLLLNKTTARVYGRVLLLFDDNKIKSAKEAREETEGKSSSVHRGVER